MKPEAHTVECPSPAVLLPIAQEGGLGPRASCLTATDLGTEDGRTSRFALWCDQAVRGVVLAIEGESLLAVVAPDDALWMAEHGGANAAFAGRAAAVALAGGASWTDPATRSDRSQRLSRLLGHAVTLPEPAAPTADELVPCASIGAAWSHALWSTPYATERDCLARAAIAAPGTDPSLGRLSVLLAIEHPDPAALSAILDALAIRFPGDPTFTREPVAR